MRRVVALGLALGLLLGMAAVPASAQLPTHPHVLVLGLELDEHGEPVGFRKCVDLAANNRLPLNAHHAHVHHGSAGEALFTHAGHVVVPVAPFPGVPWTDCESLIAFFFGD
jgi:hypothetical protein